MYLENTTGIRSKTSQIKQRSACADNDIIILIKTWFTNDIGSEEICPSNVICHRTDRSETLSAKEIGGGILIVAKKHLNSSKIMLPDKYLIETCAISIVPSNNKCLAIIAIYSPHVNKSQQAVELKSICTYNGQVKKIGQIVIIGDFNSPKITWLATDSYINSLSPSALEPGIDLIFINKIIEEGYEQIISTPNERITYLDVAFVNFKIHLYVIHLYATPQYHTSQSYQTVP